jgi:fructose-1,6-bisphosphatase/inositol monophosphatase family enzyme
VVAVLVELLRTTARVEILPGLRRLGTGDVCQKAGPLDPVTEADQATECLIAAGILRQLTEPVLIGEEASSADAAQLGLPADADLAFMVDPIDVKASFAVGMSLFGVMAAVVVCSEAVAAIHDPIGDDTALAVRGEGARTETPDGKRSDLLFAAHTCEICRVASS